MANGTFDIQQTDAQLQAILDKIQPLVTTGSTAPLGFGTSTFKKFKIIASSPITSWQIDGETMETGTDFILGAPKSLQMVTAATCSLETSLS